MKEEFVSSTDVCSEIDISRTHFFKVVERLGIETTKRRVKDRGNQKVTHIRRSDISQIAEEVTRTRKLGSSVNESNGIDDAELGGTGFFYLIQLERDHDPGRFKVGFSVDVDDRLRKHRCSAPFAEVIKTWVCRRGWERTAIDCVTVDCEQLHTEVFRTDSLDDVIARCEAFFELMPTADGIEEDSTDDD